MKKGGLKRKPWLLFLFFFTQILLALCTEKEDNVVLWDDYHSGVFPPWEFSKFGKIIENKGGKIIYLTEGIENVKGKALIICGPKRMFTREDIEKIKDFVENGGRVLILVHIPPSINLGTLLSELGFSYGSAVVYQIKDGKFSQDIVVKVFNGEFKQNLFKEVEKITVYGGFYINNAIACADGYADINKDGILSEEEKRYYGIVGYKKIGRGEVLVITDDAMFLDRYISSADNTKFAENIAEWLLGKISLSWARPDSNRGPSPCQGDVITT